MLGVGRYGPLGRDAGDAAGGAPSPRSLDIEERDAWVVLASVEGVGPVSFGRLVARFGSGRAVLAEARGRDAVRRLVGATGDDDGPPTLSPEAAAALARAAAAPGRWLEPVRRAGLEVLTLLDDGYPSRLRRIELPPPVLFLRGDPAALERERAVAVVGTRRPTEVGRSTAGRIADAIAAARGDDRVGAGPRRRRRRARRRGPGRDADRRRDRRRPRAAVPGRASRAGARDRAQAAASS